MKNNNENKSSKNYDFGWVNNSDDHDISIQKSSTIGVITDQFFMLYEELAADAFVKIGDDGQYYAATQQIGNEYYSELSKIGFVNATFYLCMTEQGQIFFIPVFKPVDLSQAAKNMELMKLINCGLNSWIKIDSATSDMVEISYDYYPYYEMQEPVGKFLISAFGEDNIINDDNHPIIAELKKNK